MDKYENAFSILYIISSSDGEVSSSEIGMIMDFLQENQKNIEFDHRQLTGTMLFLSNEELKHKLQSAAEEYLASSSAEERNNLLRFALNLVVSDGRIATEEIRMFNILGKVWKIDIDAFISENYKYK